MQKFIRLVVAIHELLLTKPQRWEQ